MSRRNSSQEIGNFNESPIRDTQSLKTNERLMMFMAEQKKFSTNVALLLNRLKPIILDALETPLKSYEHQDWSNILIKTSDNENGLMFVEPKMEMLLLVSPQNALHFWIGDNSPLRLPLNEPRYLIMNILENLENHLHDINMRKMDDLRNFNFNEYSNSMH